MQIEVLGERYQLQDPIGRGGMATIYRGRDTRMDRVVAIKVLREVYSTDPKFVTRFQREAKAASALQHPNIVQVYDYGQTDGNYFIVMELVEGTDLRRYLRSRGVLAIDRAIIIAHDVALGLGAAHRRGIVHRDVKPQNILVGRDGSIKLTDFGIASVYKDINAERLTTTGMTLGTVQYYAPEQAQGEIVNPAADVYALGIVMYEMLTGRTPFDGDTPVAVAMQHIQDTPTPPSHLNPNIPPALEEIILRCLEKVPEMRYRDGSTLARALELLGEEEIGEGLPANMTSGGAATTLANGHSSPDQMLQRQSGILRAQSAVPSHHTMDPLSYTQNGAQDFNASTTQMEQPYVPEPGAMLGSSSKQIAFGGDAGLTRPFRKGSFGTPQSQRESRFASVITVLILLATLVLLGFSLFLASVLGFLPLFGPKPNVTPTSGTALSVVPNLLHMTLSEAQAEATQRGFTVSVGDGDSKTGVVIDQSPQPGTNALPRSLIVLSFGPALTSTATVRLPPDLIGSTLAHAEEELNTLHIPFTVVSTGLDPAQQPNIVVKTDPDAVMNSAIPVGQMVKLFVVNLTTGTPTVTPGITPTPTTAPPTPTATPTTAPTPTATPITPTPTATPITPTPTGTPS